MSGAPRGIGTSVLHHDAAAMQHVRAVGDRQREPDVLLDQEHSDTSVGRGPHCGEQLLDDSRSKA